MDELDTSTFSISDILKPLDFSDVPVLKPELRDQEKKWIIQRQIENILNAEDMRVVNRHRYNEFLKENKWRHNEQSMTKWLKCKDVRFKKMKKIPKMMFGRFTNKMSEFQLSVVLSECQDLHNRKGSPNLYAWSLGKRRV